MLGLGRYSLVLALAAVFATGCGGVQGTATGALPASNTHAKAPDRARALGNAINGDDLYVVDAWNQKAYAYSYPSGKLVGQLTGLTESVTGVCADKNGDVFVTEEGNTGKDHGSYIAEFAHGATAPSALLKDAYWPESCSVDPTTGNLAAVNWIKNGVAIYTNAQGNPTYVPTGGQMDWVTYDGSGDLFVSANSNSSHDSLEELSYGSSSFAKLPLNEPIRLGALQWEDGDLVTSAPSTSRMTLDLYSIQVSGSKGSVVGTTVLDELAKFKTGHGEGQTLILNNSVLAPGTPGGNVQSWPYPAGGKVKKTVVRHVAPWGIAISVSSSKRY